MTRESRDTYVCKCIYVDIQISVEVRVAEVRISADSSNGAQDYFSPIAVDF